MPDAEVLVFAAASAAPDLKSDPPIHNLLRPKNGLDKGVHFRMTEEEILKDFPYLEKEDFQAVYEFFASIPERISVLEASR